MIYDLLNKYGKYFKNLDVVLDNYRLKNGIYYKLNQDGTFEKLWVEKDTNQNTELYQYFKIRDLYSNYIDSNKAIPTQTEIMYQEKKCNMLKKICSNNPYTLFFKNKYLEDLCSKEANKEALPTWIFEKGIDKYYSSLVEMITMPKKEDEMIMEQLRGNYLLAEQIMEQKAPMLKAFYTVIEDLKAEEMPKEIWIRIFLDKTEEDYEKASNLYIMLNIFNNNHGNKTIDGEIFGINNYNFGANSKKPYLELKTTSYKIASRVDLETINVIKNLYLWLLQNGTMKTFVTLPQNYDFCTDNEKEDTIRNQNIFLLKAIDVKGQARILDYDSISNYSTKIKDFHCENYLESKYSWMQPQYTDNIYRLEWIVNNIWITNNMKSERNVLRESYYKEKEKENKSKQVGWKKMFLEKYSAIFLNLFRKENAKPFQNKLQAIGCEVVENTLIDDMKDGGCYQISNAVNAMNLWIALDLYFMIKGGNLKMKIDDVKKRASDIVLKDQEIMADDEYYYLAGQVAYYLLSKSEAGKLTQDETEPFVKSGNIKKLKKELEFLYNKYKHAIYLKDRKFNHVFSELMLKEPESNVKENKPMILAGMLSNNLFFQPNELKEVGGNENE